MIRKTWRFAKKALGLGLISTVIFTCVQFSYHEKPDYFQEERRLLVNVQKLGNAAENGVFLSPRSKVTVRAEKNAPIIPEDIIFNEEDMLDEHGRRYTIIIWVNSAGKPGYAANPLECLANISCQITYDKSLLNKAHAVVFKSDSLNRGNLPSERQGYQQFAWWASESPIHSSVSGGFDNYFNLTFHYRTDADVYAPYGSINLILRELNASGETELEPLLAKKRKANKMAIWAVSNCYAKRMDYAKSLMAAGLEVDTFGRCFGGKEIGRGRYSSQMYEKIENYKFYFSFENSIDCKDYFTEKFWFNGLRSGTIPIVWGPKKSDLLKVAPSKSFIHTGDYKTPEELVKYLQYLASNETAYAEYFHWRSWIKHPERIEEHLTMTNRDHDLRSFCKLCSIVQADGKRRKLGLESPKKVINSLKDAWLGEEKGQCHG
ncbi:4-galactosyl-N-acetylglucosaminide 3-alpha-L-fucosyltransferase 9-like [Clavelina lepadiformis]|uniref:Fucosyltransferase n=1 Tax=Clavelina lepadiformis TaxID=159417 RepID=A0ABP0GZ46_CLALP